MENSTIYSHLADIQSIISILEGKFGRGQVKIYGEKEDWQKLKVTVGKKFWRSGNTLELNCRRRKTPDYQLKEIDEPITQNLAGMYNYVQSIPSKNETVKGKLLVKITTINTEIGVKVEPEFIPAFQEVILEIAQEMDAFLFSNGNSFLNSPNSSNGFWDKNGKLLIDAKGNCEVEDLSVNVLAKFHESAESDTLTENQLQRKAKSENILSAQGIPFSKTLPTIEEEAVAKIRTKNEIVDRAIAILFCAVKGEGLEEKHLNGFYESFKVADKLSPKENQFRQNSNPTEAERGQFTWKYEGLWIFLWILGFIEKLDVPTQICDVPFCAKTIFEREEEGFRNEAKMKSKKEILDQADLIYRYNWACVNARIKGQQPAGNLNSGIVFERHYAFNWLRNYLETDWDDVRTDT